MCVLWTEYDYGYGSGYELFMKRTSWRTWRVTQFEGIAS